MQSETNWERKAHWKSLFIHALSLCGVPGARRTGVLCKHDSVSKDWGTQVPDRQQGQWRPKDKVVSAVSIRRL